MSKKPDASIETVPFDADADGKKSNEVHSPVGGGVADDGLIKSTQVIASKTTRYTVRRKIADAYRGAVYEVSNERGETFALKTESRNGTKDPRLGMEIAVLRHLRQHSVLPYFPEYVDRCARTTYYFMVTSLLGKSLDKFINHKTNSFLPTKMAIGVTWQMLDALKELHNLGYVHRDVGPHNMCIGIGEKAHIVHLINFSNCAIYTKNGKVRKARANVPMRGHPQFASLTAHDNAEQAPKDDIEMLIYTMYYLCDKLPWCTTNKSAEIKAEKAKCRKDEGSKARLHRKVDSKVSTVLQYLDDIRFGDPIDYEFIRKTIQECVKAANITGTREKLSFDKLNPDSNVDDDDEGTSSTISKKDYLFDN